MNDVPDTDLFSAYLDGELTADEQVRIEQILATSPEARQLLEELRALGSTLQGLPQEKLDEDLSARVLEVAERRMLLPADTGEKPSAGRPAQSLASPDTETTGWLGIPWREVSWRGMLSKRAVIWSVVVVATAIIISVTSPPAPKPNQNIAKLDEGREAASPAAGEASRKVSSSDRSWNAPAGSPDQSRTADMLAGNEKRKAADRDQFADKLADKRNDLANKVAQSDRTVLRAKSASKQPSDDAAKGAPMSDEAKPAGIVQSEPPATAGVELKKESPPGAALADSKPAPALEPSAAPASTMTPALVVAKPAAELPRPIVAMSVAPPAPAAPAAPALAQVAGTKDAANVQLGQRKDGPAYSDNESPHIAASEDKMRLMNGTGYAGAANAGNTNGSQASASRYVRRGAVTSTVVHLNVSTVAMQNKVFESLLAHNGLGVAQTAASDERRALEVEGNMQSPAATNSTQGAVASQAPSAKSEGQRENAKYYQQAPRPVVYECDVSPEQFAILIKQVGENADAFSALQIESGAPAAPAANSFAQANHYGMNNSQGTASGGRSAHRGGEQEHSKADADGAQAFREEAAQSQSAPVPAPLSGQQAAARAAGAAKQHVVFVLSVVDRAAPAAAAPAATLPAKQ